MPPLFILRFWLGVQGEYCKNDPCSEFCRCTLQKCWTNSYIDYIRPSSFINVLIEITDCLLSAHPPPLCHSLCISIICWKPHLFKKVNHIIYVFFKGSKWGWMNCFVARQGSADSQSSNGKMLGLLLGQVYVGPNSLWAPFVAIIVQLMYCLVLCCVGALLRASPQNTFVCPTKIDILNSPL